MEKFDKLVEIAYYLLPLHRGDLRAFHVAGIYKKKRLISIGWNSKRSHVKNIEYGYDEFNRRHAELHAVLKGRLDDYSGYTIAVLRINRNNYLDFSKPCEHCEFMIRQLNFKNCFYSTEIGHFNELELN